MIVVSPFLITRGRPLQAISQTLGGLLFFAVFNIEKRGFARKPSRYAFAGRPLFPKKQSNEPDRICSGCSGLPGRYTFWQEICTSFRLRTDCQGYQVVLLCLWHRVGAAETCRALMDRQMIYYLQMQSFVYTAEVKPLRSNRFEKKSAQRISNFFAF